MAERELFPSNSNKAKEQREAKETALVNREHAKPVAKRLKPEEVKPTMGQKFAKLFLAEDVSDIGEYLVKDLIIPTIKDVFLNFMNAALWGDRRSGDNYRSGKTNRTPYYKASESSRVRNLSDRRRDEDREERSKFDISNIVFSTRAQADAVLAQMEDYIDAYGQVTVGYLYELMDESGDYTVEYYGWRNLRNARIGRVRNGYSLELPRPVRLS